MSSSSPRQSTPLDPAQTAGTRSWPSVAAAAAAVLGMGSCVYTMRPAGPWLASIAAVAIAGAIFAMLLRVVRAPLTADDRARAIDSAAVISWVACVVTGYFEPYWFERLLAHDRGAQLGVAWPFGVLVGIVLGLGVAGLVRAIARSLWR